MSIVKKQTKKKTSIKSNSDSVENKQHKKYKKVLKDFFLTKNAINRIKEIKKDNEEIFIRVMVISGGCAGKQYYILMDDYIGETDYVLIEKFKRKNSIFVVIDEQSLKLLHNSTMDFSNELEFSGFTIDNPNVKAFCNCGNSFSCSDCNIISNGQNCSNK